MDNKLEYIPGDLVMTNGISGGTAKNVVYKVMYSDPSKICVLDDGTVLKGIVRLENLENAKLEDEGYLYYGNSHVYSKDIIPIPITPEILEENGWKIEDVNPHDFSNIVSNGVMYRAIKDKEILFFLKGASVFTCPLNWRKIEIRYVHELQHLLFGLGLNHEIEV